MAVFSPTDPTPAYLPDREVLVNNVRAAADAAVLVREAFLAESADAAARAHDPSAKPRMTHEQRLIVRAYRSQNSRTRNLMRPVGS